MGRINTNINWGKSFMNIDTIIETVKKLEKSGNDISIIVKNIKTKEEGVATILPNGNIAVFEGSENGSYDKIYSIKNFKKNYSIIKLENELGEEFE